MDEIVEFESASQWDKWLAKNFSRSKGIWIRFFKKASDVSSIDTSDALDMALCYGWITGQARPYYERSWLGRFVPRRPKSIWSNINTKRAEKLIRQGRMKPSGLRQVEEAKKDGRWDRAYSPPSTARLPEDFIKALQKNKKAEASFRTLNRGQYLFSRVQAPECKERRAKEDEDQAHYQDVREKGEVPLINLPNLAKSISPRLDDPDAIASQFIFDSSRNRFRSLTLIVCSMGSRCQGHL